MTKNGKIALSIMVLLTIGFTGFRGFLWYYDQSNSYVRLEGKDENTQLIEFKPSLFELRSTIQSEGLARDTAILKLLSQLLRELPANYSGCKIENVFGNINNYILAQVRCNYEAEA